MEKHHGCLSAIAEELGVSRQAVAQQLECRGLTRHAAQLRAKHGIPGSGSVEVPGDRARVLHAIATLGSQAAAALKLGVSKFVIQRRVARYQITEQEIEAERKRHTTG